jgi:hypothetical protein
LQENGFFWKFLGLLGIPLFFNKDIGLHSNNYPTAIINTPPTTHGATTKNGSYATKPVAVTMQDGSTKTYPAGTFFIKDGGKYRVDINGKTEWVTSLPNASNKIVEVSKNGSSNIKGEFVTAGKDGRIFPETYGYPRFAEDSATRSNCTYYAAHAVYQESNGKIEMNGTKASLGPGGNWATSVEKIITTYDQEGISIENRKFLDVNRVPSAGDVYCDDKYHVAFVEETWISEDGKQIFVVVSEENAGLPDGRYIGQPINRETSSPILEEEGIKRFRRTIVFNNTKDINNPEIPDKQGRFIKINYDYEGE